MNKIGRIVCCAVLCVPMVAAIIVGITGRNGGIGDSGIPGSSGVSETAGLSKVKILSADGTLLKEYTTDDKECLEMYLKVVNDSSPVNDMPRLADEVFTHYSVNYIGGAEEYAYEFIMSSESEANCFFKDINEQLYSIKAEDARLLLVRDEFADSNKYANVAKLYIEYVNGTEPVSSAVSADTYSWNYTRLDGELVARADSESASELPSVTFPKGATEFKMSFGLDAAPSTLNVTAKNGVNVVYSGEPSALPLNLKEAQDTVFDITVDAEWLEGSDTDYYGSAKYNFKLLYDVPSNFKLADAELGAGEFTIIEVKGGNAGEKVTAQADFMSAITESFIHNGKQYIYVPIKADAAAGSYDIKVTENAGTSVVKFRVNSRKKFGETEIIMPSTEITELLTDDNVNEYTALIGEHRHTCSDTMLWDGKFVLPVKDGKTACAFGYKLNIAGNERISDGMYISGANGASVIAANKGTVIFAGSTAYSGNAVIIDHGLGVLSYYMNLGSVSCKSGDSVDKSSVIGTVGSTGYTPYSDTVFYANSVGGCFVNPETQIKYGISFPN
ncbi:MAG: M23 family metallopeptidase [Clostridia bacterium]|nr:M23 family metallopeptidase [Clostridia bacterium]